MYLLEIEDKFKNIIDKTDFRISIFGSARIKEGEPNYKLIEELSYRLALEDIALITGGGMGLMDAASKGHKMARKQIGLFNDPIVNIGLNIKLPFEEYASLHLDIKKEFERFSERLEYFMQLSNAVIVSVGGIGTLLEFFYSWQLIQVNHINEFPIILFAPDDRWQQLMDWINIWLLENKLIDEKDLDCIFIVKDIDSVISLLRTYKQNNKIINRKLMLKSIAQKSPKDNFENYINSINNIVLQYRNA